MLRLLLSDARLRSAAGQKGQSRAREHYLWDRVTAEVANVYADLIPPRSRRKFSSIAPPENNKAA